MTETLIPAAPEVVTPERVTPLRPSEALRLGRLTRPVCTTGRFFRGESAACALGAIAAGLGFEPPVGDSRLGDDIVATDFIYARWPALNTTEVFIHNDFDHWSDDQIVAWLEERGL